MISIRHDPSDGYDNELVDYLLAKWRYITVKYTKSSVV